MQLFSTAQSVQSPLWAEECASEQTEKHGGLCTAECNYTTWTSWYLCQTALDIQCVGACWIILRHTKY